MVLSGYDCPAATLAAAVRRFHGKRIVILGDVMLDRFVWGSVSRISPEAPVPVVEIRSDTTCLGGAANVAANISSLRGEPLLLSVVGLDAEGELLRSKLEGLGADAGGVLCETDRITCVKTRVIAHQQQVCRIDREDRTPVGSRTQRRIAQLFRARLEPADGVIVSDYAKGLVSAPLLKSVLPPARAAGKVVCVDPKMRNFAAYKPCTVITPNLAETEHAAGQHVGDEKSLSRAGAKILRQPGIDHLLVTRGEHGMALFTRNAGVSHIPTHAQEVFDVTGAGDTVIAVLCLGLAAGLPVLHAALLANIAAGIVVAKLGTATVAPEELLAAIERSSRPVKRRPPSSDEPGDRKGGRRGQTAD